MTRRIYKALLLVSLILFTVLFAREINLSASKLFPHVDKVGHFAVFAILAFISHHAFKAPVWLHLILLSGYGIAIELMQHTLPYRQASFADFIADVAGALGYFVSFYFYSLWRQRSHG
ncbi:VanZ family protein [Pseudoalteromonas sp. T1lg65]|uniref:VanZ family protein n=1 Tax=Pseudoalteromonas sp. T1lg65 TaxID=2077101 RepID=UPI003F79C650